MSPDAKMTRDRIVMTLCASVIALALAGLLALPYVDGRHLHTFARLF